MSNNRQCISAAQAKAPCFVGVDLGMAGVVALVVDHDGQCLAQASAPIDPTNSPAETLRLVERTVGEAIAKTGLPATAIVGVGMGVPGALDVASGRLVDPVGLVSVWDGFPIREQFGTCCGLPVSIVHQTIAAVFGEAWLGAGRDLPSLLLFTLGPRIGSGLLFGDPSIDGKTSYGIDSSHMIIDLADDAPICVCGQRGHLDAYICDAAIVARAQRALDSDRDSTLTHRLAQAGPLTIERIVQEAEAGDAVALEVVTETAHCLGVGIVNQMNTLDPDGILLGGTTTFGGHESPLGRQFLQSVKDEVARRAFPSMIARVVIDYAALGHDGVCLGAAGIARLNHTTEPGK